MAEYYSKGDREREGIIAGEGCLEERSWKNTERGK